jgi:hypothetical protein
VVPRTRRIALLAAALGALALPVAPAAAKPVVRTGEVLAIHGHTKHGRAVERSWALQAGSRTIALDLSGVRSHVRPGVRVRVAGEERASRLRVRTLRVLPGRPRARAAHLLDGAKRVAVILYDFAAGPARTPSRTPASVRSNVFDGAGSMRAYLEETTGGRVSVTGDVYGYYTINPAAGSRPTDGQCAWAAWRDEAKAAAQAAGVDLSGYDRILYLHARVSACSYAGLAPLSSAPLGMGTFIELNDDDSTRVTTHEWGHTYGLDHSSSYRCTSGGVAVAISTSCTQSEYGDPFDTMGSGSGRWFQAYERVAMGLLPATTGTQTVTTSGQYTIGALAFSGTPSRLLRIARGDGTIYGLEFRQPFGSAFEAWSSAAPVVNGVTIRILPANYSCCWNPLPRLIDTVPSTTTFTDAPLLVGRTFEDNLDASRTITIRTDAVGPDGATVTVDLHDGNPVPPAQQTPSAEPPATTPPPTSPPGTVTPPPTTEPPTVKPPTTKPPVKRPATKKKKAKLSRKQRAAIARKRARAAALARARRSR